MVGRAVPVIMFDPISYAAGLVKVKDWQYFLATFIGSIPRAIIYAYLGIQLIGGGDPQSILTMDPAEIELAAKQFNLYFWIIFGVLVFMFVLSNVIYYVKKWKEKKEAEGEETVGEKDQAELEEIQAELKKIEEEPIEIVPATSDGPQFEEPETEVPDVNEEIEEDDEEEDRFGDAFE